MAWFDQNWGYRKKITIDSTKVVSTQSNFPVLYSVTDSDLRHADFGGKVGKIDGGDILFTSLSSDATSQLSHEIDSYDSTTGELIVWIRIPTLSSSVDTEIYIYYGYESASDQQDPTGVWDDNYMAVYHMSDETTSTISDSTQYGNDGTKTGANAPAETNGKISKAQDFEKDNSDQINCGNGSSLNITQYITLSTWLNLESIPSANDGWYDILSKENPFNYSLYVYRPAAGETYIAAYFVLSSGVVDIFTGPDINLSPGNWYYLTVTYDGASIDLYVNDTLDYSQNETGTINDSSTLDLIFSPADDEYLDGIVDEARVSNIARSADWIAIEFNNQNSPGTFYSTGPEEALWSGKVNTINRSIIGKVNTVSLLNINKINLT
jgi:hypothetical protein